MSTLATEAGYQVIGALIQNRDEFMPRFLASDGNSHLFADQYQAAIYRGLFKLWCNEIEPTPRELKRVIGDGPPFTDTITVESEIARIAENYVTGAHWDLYYGRLWAGWKERELRRAIDSAQASNGDQSLDEKIADLEAAISRIRTCGAGRHAEKLTFEQLAAQFPTLNPPVVDGVCRQGETVNIIAAPKVGKSWLGYSLLLSIITGCDWLDTFPTVAGKCLLIDLELHPSTLAYRIAEVADAMGIPRSDYAKDLEVWTLRGRVRSLADLAVDLKRIKPSKLRFSLFDSKYRMAERGQNENDNNSDTWFYNTVDQYAAESESAVGLIHHSSKGNQADTRTTDVGSGAGAQSRAADTHLVLREHETEGRIVLDGVVRSFAPFEPLVLSWQFPLWHPDHSADPGKLRGKLTVNEQRQGERDREANNKIIAALKDGTRATVRSLRESTGLSRERLSRLLDKGVSDGWLKYEERSIRGNQTREYYAEEDG